MTMKTALLTAAAVLSLGVGVAVAEPVHDWRDLDAVHTHVQEAIHEMADASARNHYDMDGHAKKAEDLLKRAERELNRAIESAKNAE